MSQIGKHTSEDVKPLLNDAKLTLMNVVALIELNIGEQSEDEAD
jgi:hypothetical protein